jgi:hypothetical protein
MRILYTGIVWGGWLQKPDFYQENLIIWETMYTRTHEYMHMHAYRPLPKNAPI